jgi:hypothetical protein
MLRGRSLRIVGVPVLALTLFSACYRYVPTSSADLTVGNAYRGHFTPEGSQRVASLVGVNVERFDGRLISVLDTALLVSMGSTLKRSEQRPTIWSGEQLMIPRSTVNRFELRELDRPRTLRAAALYTGGIVLLGVLVFSIKSRASGEGTIPPPPPPP